MKIELSILSKKITILAGFCAVLNGLIIGLQQESDSNSELESGYKFLNNYHLYWSTH